MEVGAQWIQIDLGQNYGVTSLNLWHYFADARTYRDVIVKLSTTSDFSSGVTTVFNNDTNNSAGQGTGTDAEYAESAAGKTITFGPVTARFVRLWTNGSSANGYNHYVEVEVWAGGGGATPTATARPGGTATATSRPTSTSTSTPTPRGPTPTPGTGQITWSGRVWDIRPASVGGPGPNTWDPRNTFVDANGHLHMQIVNRNGTWTSTEIQLAPNQRLGFGTFQFQMQGRPDLLDHNTVFGFYTYPPSDVGGDATNEIDIEFSRWANPNARNGNYTVWPAVNGVPRSWAGWEISSSTQQTHRFIWTSNRITFQSMNGFVPVGSTAGMYSSWVFEPANPPNPTETPTLQFYCSSHNPLQCISQQPQYFLINFWQVSGQAPASGTTQEVVLTNFTYVPQ
jgi:hypothetical protein